ncbi:glycoside hydrolase family 1 protein [Enterococcus gallinarum]|uniref:glycoside hydrolase family 1 protein n=1 Tax=Enterococcus gallinarum TaxID=1353 RepID=UPI001AD7129E|nr:glycoside hydrolase family 1 protein [Enterococcus gallinarum]MBO6332665.1 glycoside hydrolase family 1 protein [Enterococcus gallinarum]MBO6353391.1 glycoside hydrolase family 1 protein [Enterococcus gallinarum]MBO6393640.1 glycoside hydrolase family 1 protein [Enterococcus gallinarum]MBO6423954.1 glycoside hydrolase family 1 protein [Enterococcus gallinarum]MDV7743078.1 glycoside hydrolase family 1 protein [Enterococcus gallinarum]
MLTFPKDFWWGAATSGPQSEGRFQKKHANMFDHWYDIEPEVFYDRVGPDMASNFYNSYREDIALMKQTGLNSLRTSIQWTRLIKDLETNEVDPVGVAFYNNVIDEFLSQNIRPIFNLHHFDLPVELYHKYGGWESKKVVDLFVGFAEQCFALFGDRVKDWVTHNEPMVVVDGEYLFQFHYPKLVDGKKAVQVAYNLNLASAKVMAKFREMGQPQAGGRIGTVLNLTPTYAASDAEADQEAARIAELWNNKMFLDPAIKGEFPVELLELLTKDGVLWQSTADELALIKKNTVDFIGVNFYHPNRVKTPDIAPNSVGAWMPDRYYDAYQMPGRRMNIDKGWEIYPKAVYDIAINIRDNYGNLPWFVSENGMGVSREERFMDEKGQILDDYRIEFIKEHLQWLHKGIEEGSNCFGYHLWTPIDCWSWSNAYRNRYGLIANDIHTQIKTIKKSGEWFKTLAENNGF